MVDAKVDILGAMADMMCHNFGIHKDRKYRIRDKLKVILNEELDYMIIYDDITDLKLNVEGCMIYIDKEDLNESTECN